MQEYIKINNKLIKQPAEYAVNLATTSTDASGRNQFLKMMNTPVGTVNSYSLKWQYLTTEELSGILQEVINKSQFLVHYEDAYEGIWKDGYFYASNFNAPCKTLKENEEKWESLSFNIIGVEAI